jgi:hypothetical protein
MSNLSHQFDGAEKAYEDAQRRRYARKQESGFVGNGFLSGIYPGVVGGFGTGTITQTQSGQYENPIQELGENTGAIGSNGEETNETANTNSGMGEGGTAVTGAAGGGMP